MRSSTPIRTTLLLLSMLLAACVGSQQSAGTPEPSGAVHGAPPGPQPGGGCEAQTTCEACLAVAGCNWTGGTCAASCLMDTSCYGPGNPAASTCTPIDPNLHGDWHEDQARSAGNEHVFVRRSVDLGPARYRQSYSFGPEGRLKASVLDPADAHGEAEGRWWLDDKVLHGTWEGGSFAYELVSVTDAELRLRELPPPNL